MSPDRRDVDGFMQARGIAATALDDMTNLLRQSSLAPQGAPYLAFSALLQVIAEGYRDLGFSAEDAERSMHHGVAVACRQRAVPIDAVWIEARPADRPIP